MVQSPGIAWGTRVVGWHRLIACLLTLGFPTSAASKDARCGHDAWEPNDHRARARSVPEPGRAPSERRRCAPGL